MFERKYNPCPRVTMSHFASTLPQIIIVTHWSGHLCLASGTSDLSLCHDGSPTNSWEECAHPGVHVWQRDDSQWISILISRPSAPWQKGNWDITENTIVFKWFIIQQTQWEDTQTPSEPTQRPKCLTHFSLLYKVTHSTKQWEVEKMVMNE